MFRQYLKVWEKGHFGVHELLRIASFLVVQRAWGGMRFALLLGKIQLSINSCVTESDKAYRINAWGRNLAK